MLLKKLYADLDEGQAYKHSVVTSPEAQPNQKQVSPHYAAMRRTEAYIAENYARGVTLEQAAAHVDMAPTYFSRIFKQERGYSLIEYLTRVRLEEAKRLLRTTTLPVSAIGRAIGYQGPNYLAEVFKAVESATPAPIVAITAAPEHRSFIASGPSPGCRER